MKYLILLFILSCTQKYSNYDLIRKVDFNQPSYERPVTQYQVMARGQDELGQCFNQWLFNSNAEKLKLEQLPFLVRALCPQSDYLVNAEFKETWWTSLIFTQSCISIKTTCGNLNRNNK